MTPEEQCPACHGQKTIPCRVQRIVQGRRSCTMEAMPCPICKGTGFATDQDVEAFLNDNT